MFVKLGQEFARAAVPVDERAVDEHIAELQANNTRKFALAREYINIEQKKTADLRAELHEITAGKKSIMDFSPLHKYRTGTITVGATDLTTPEDTRQTEIRDELDGMNKDSLKVISKFEAMEHQNTQKAISKDLAFASPDTTTQDRLLADATNRPSSATSSNPSTPSTVTGATYHYEGIYYRSSNGKTARLFAFTSELSGKEEALKIYPSGTNNLARLVQIGQGLYIKNKTNPLVVNHIPVTTAVAVRDIHDALPLEAVGLPKASPNFFKQASVKPSGATVRFSPASTDRDTMFRLEYMKTVDGFDNLRQGIAPNTDSGQTMGVMDLITDVSDQTVIPNGGTGGVTLHSTPAYIKSGYGEASVTMPNMKILTTNNRITVGANKVIYTDSAGARIAYQP